MEKKLHVLSALTLFTVLIHAQKHPTITCAYEQEQVYDVNEPRDEETVRHENVEEVAWNPDNPNNPAPKRQAKGFCNLPENKEQIMLPEDEDLDNYALSAILIEQDGEKHEYSAEDIEGSQHMREFVYEGTTK